MGVCVGDHGCTLHHPDPGAGVLGRVSEAGWQVHYHLEAEVWKDRVWCNQLLLQLQGALRPRYLLALDLQQAGVMVCGLQEMRRRGSGHYHNEY